MFFRPCVLFFLPCSFRVYFRMRQCLSWLHAKFHENRFIHSSIAASFLWWIIKNDRSLLSSLNLVPRRCCFKFWNKNAAVQECGFTLINHLCHSLSLTPSDYFLFQNLKQHLRGTRFRDDSEVQSAVEEYFDGCDKSFFLNGLKHLKSQWEKWSWI